MNETTLITPLKFFVCWSKDRGEREQKRTVSDDCHGTHENQFAKMSKQKPQYGTYYKVAVVILITLKSAKFLNIH